MTYNFNLYKNNVLKSGLVILKMDFLFRLVKLKFTITRCWNLQFFKFGFLTEKVFAKGGAFLLTRCKYNKVFNKDKT